MKINFLSNKIAWFGKYSGYECLENYLPEQVKSTIFYCNNDSLWNKVHGKFLQKIHSLNSVKASSLSIGAEFLRSSNKHSINHILYLESNISLLKIADEKKLRTLTSTIHLPLSQWKEIRLKELQPLKNALILYESELEKFQEYLPDCKLHFIKHGVDNSFFKPGDQLRDRTKLLCVGHYLRNFLMFERVVERLLAKNQNISVHIVVPSRFRSDESLIKLSRRDQVFFYENLTDEELLSLYQTCGSLLMPMNDSGANTALVQGIACGIPIITTNVGGIASYGGNSVFPIVENNDDNAMVELASKYIEDADLSVECSSKIRAFSIESLDWKKIALEHVDYYKEILSK